MTTRGTITDEVRDKVQNFLLIDTWRSNIDGVLMFTTDPKTALNREVDDKIITDEGSAMNWEVLGQLNEAYEQVQRVHADAFAQFKIIDTSQSKKTTPRSTGEEAVAWILDVLDSSLASHRAS